MSSKKEQTISSSSSIELQTGRLPPAAKEMERSILGLIMLERDAIDTASAWLTPEAFYIEAHQRVYRAMMTLNLKSHALDELTVVQQLITTGELQIVGGHYYIAELTKSVVSSAKMEQYCLIVKQKFIQRELIRVGAQTFNDGFDESGDPFDLLDKAEQDLMQIGNSVQSDAKGMDTVLVETLTQIEVWRKNESTLTGIPSGFRKLDQCTRGWQPGDLIILGARPAVGKTAIALQLVREAAKGCPVAIWSLEMESKQLNLRMLAAESGITLYQLQTGRLDDEMMKKLHTKGVNPLASLKIFFDDKPGLTLSILRSKARRLKKKHGVGLIVIDYLQLMSGIGKTREQEISSLSRGLKNLAKELQIPIIALSQLSREIEGRSGSKRKPQLSDLRESGSIEQDADVVLLLWAPDEDEIAKDASLSTRRHIRIAKQRNGMLTSADLDFQDKIQLFKEYEPEAQPVTVAGSDGKYKPVIKELF